MNLESVLKIIALPDNDVSIKLVDGKKDITSYKPLDDSSLVESLSNPENYSGMTRCLFHDDISILFEPKQASVHKASIEIRICLGCEEALVLQNDARIDKMQISRIIGHVLQVAQIKFPDNDYIQKYKLRA